MRAESGIFGLRSDAERAARKLQSGALDDDRIILLVSGDSEKQLQSIPLSSEEGTGIGVALGMVMGAAAGLAGGFEVGPIAATQAPGGFSTLSVWGAVIFLGLAGLVVGALLGNALDHATAQGLPRDELPVYRKAIRNGFSIVLAFTQDAHTAKFFRRLLAAEGAESMEKARKRGWKPMGSQELETYPKGILGRAGESVE